VKDEKIRFVYVNLEKEADFCNAFIKEKSNTFNLIMLRGNKSKYSTLLDANNENTEKMIENTLYGLQKFEFIEDIPLLSGNSKQEL
jgi:hypothetical protein